MQKRYNLVEPLMQKRYTSKSFTNNRESQNLARGTNGKDRLGYKHFEQDNYTKFLNKRIRKQKNQETKYSEQRIRNLNKSSGNLLRSQISTLILTSIYIKI